MNTPWASGDVIFEPAILDAIAAHAAESYPNEACGFVVGPADDAPRLDEARRCENAQDEFHALDPDAYPRTARTAYLIEPRVIMKAFDGPEAGARPVKVIYHSHADVGAYFSDEDRRAATFGDAPAYAVAYVVASVRGRATGDVDGFKLFAWDGAGYAEVPLRVRGREP